MPDPVVDLLWNFPGLPAWQTDADGADTNGPQDSDLIKSTTPTGLAGELRRIKDQTREFSLDPGWINYLGWKNAPSIQPPQFDAVSTPVGAWFTLAGDWSAIALVGRRVRATLASQVRVVGTIITSTFGGGVTRVQLDSALLNAGLSYVEFSAAGSLLAQGDPALGPHNGDNAFGVDFGIVNNKFVLGVQHGGTGRTDLLVGNAGPIVSDVAGNLASDPTEPIPLTVQGLQGNHVNAATPSLTDQDQVFWWNLSGGGGWQPALLSQLVLVPAVQAAIQTFLNFTANVGTGVGTITIPIIGAPMFIKWAIGTELTPTPPANSASIQIPFDSAFPGQVLALSVVPDSFDVVCAASVPLQGQGYALVTYKNIGAAPVTTTFTVIAIGN